MLLADMNLTTPLAAGRWDAGMIAGCVCDAGFSGPDCSQRACAGGGGGGGGLARGPRHPSLPPPSPLPRRRPLPGGR
jgi:hypothetical protein